MSQLMQCWKAIAPWSRPTILVTWAGTLGFPVLLSTSFAADPAKPVAPAPAPVAAVEAPSGFMNASNGYQTQEQFNKDRDVFEEVENITINGLGPVYNGTSCAGCHQNPVTGSSSQVSVLRVGHHIPDPAHPGKKIFIEPAGGSLIYQRATNPAAQVQVLPGNEVRTLRMSTNLLGNGYIELIPDKAILDLRDKQPAGMKGLPIAVPVTVGVDAKGGFTVVERLGRFGWKNQEASLLNFSAGAYVNEMGVTSPMQPNENTSNGKTVSQFDPVGDPEDKVGDPKNDDQPFGDDVKTFTRFIRSTRVPSRSTELATNDDVVAGEALFRDNNVLGCAICHHPDYTTPAAGSLIEALPPKSGVQGSDLNVVPAALANKVFHPYSDFMLHDIGTGDGIVQTSHARYQTAGAATMTKYPAESLQAMGITRIKAVPHLEVQRALSDEPGLDQRTMNMMRTAPLWGLRVRPQLLHDGSAITIDEAIRKHKGEADPVTLKYLALTTEKTRQLLAFLKSL